MRLGLGLAVSDFGSTGLAADAADGRNILPNTNDLSNAAWTKSNITPTAASIAAPDGTLTGWKVAATASVATLLNQGSAIATAPNASLILWVKKGSGATDANIFALRNATTATTLVMASINWDTLAIGYIIGSSGMTVTSINDGWVVVKIAVSSGISIGNSLIAYMFFPGNAETAGEYAYFWKATLTN